MNSEQSLKSHHMEYAQIVQESHTPLRESALAALAALAKDFHIAGIKLPL